MQGAAVRFQEAGLTRMQQRCSRLAFLAAAATMIGAAPAHAQSPVPLPTSTATTSTTTTPPPAAPPPVVPPAGPADATTVRFGDGTRRAWVAANGLTPPLKARWRTDLGQPVNDVVVGGAQLFADVASDSEQGSVVVGLDAATGAVAWRTPLAHQFTSARLAFAPGHVLALDDGGTLTALDPSTGAVQWHAPAASGGLVSGSPLVAADEVVVADQAVTAYDLATGAQRWQTADADAALQGDPAVSGDRIYLAGGCTTLALDRTTGAVLWRTNGGCTSGSPGRVTLTGDRVANDAGTTVAPVQSASDGSTLAGVLPLAATDQIAVSGQPSGGVVASSLTDPTPIWQSPDFVTHVLAVGSSLYTESQGALRLRDLGTGALQWSGALMDGGPGEPPPAVGDDELIQPIGRVLVALVAASAATQFPFSLTVGHADQTAGRPVALRGHDANPLQDTVRAEVDEAPFDAAHGYVAQGAPLTDDSLGGTGELTAHVAVLGNAMVRLAPVDGSPPSAPVMLYVSPRITLAGRRRGSGLRVRATVVGRGVAGQELALYRTAINRFTRIGEVRLKGATTSRGTLSVARPPRGQRLAACVVHADRLAMGRPRGLRAHCGARSVRTRPGS